MKKTDWLYGIGVTISIISLLSLIIPPLSLVLALAGITLVAVSEKSLLTKALTIAVPVVLWILVVIN